MRYKGENLAAQGSVGFNSRKTTNAFYIVEFYEIRINQNIFSFFFSKSDKNAEKVILFLNKNPQYKLISMQKLKFLQDD